MWRTENPLALLFKDNATFDAQNPIIGSLLREIDLAKKSTNSGLIKKTLSKAPDINDTILIQIFKKLKENPINYGKDDDDDDNNNKPNTFEPGPAPPPPTFSDFSDIFEPPPPPPSTQQPPSIFQPPTL